MNEAKRKRLEAAGWKVGTVKEFLGLSDAEESLIEMKLALARTVKLLRLHRDLTQGRVAKLLRSSQSRVAKMEAADPTVSLDLLFRSVFVLGGTRRDLAKLFAPATGQRRRPASTRGGRGRQQAAAV